MFLSPSLCAARACVCLQQTFSTAAARLPSSLNAQPSGPPSFARAFNSCCCCWRQALTRKAAAASFQRPGVTAVAAAAGRATAAMAKQQLVLKNKFSRDFVFRRRNGGDKSLGAAGDARATAGSPCACVYLASRRGVLVGGGTRSERVTAQRARYAVKLLARGGW